GHTRTVDAWKERRRKPNVLAHRVESVVGLGEGFPPVLKHDRHSPELHVGRQRLDPLLEEWLEIATVRTTIGKKLDHFDLAARFNRLRDFDPRVLLPFD